MVRLLFRLLLAAILVAAIATAGTLGAKRLHAAALPMVPVVTSSTHWAAAPGAAPAIVTPADGSMAVAAIAGGVATPLVSSDAQTMRPIASVAKTMTALVILELHPLLPAQAGPTLVMTQQDVNDYLSIRANGGSYARVTVGERLTEHDLLLGLMLPSANNLALTAARWIDGSVGAFVRRINARASALGMVHTHFADPDGLDAATTSTASDLVLLGEKAVANDALVGVVSTTSATLPDGSTVQNLDILLGDDPGWIGIKTGWTPHAGGCLLFAARRTLTAGAAPLTVVGAVLGQPPDGNVDIANPELGGALMVARSAVDTAFSGYAEVRVGPGSIPVSGTVFAAWGTATALRVSGPDALVLLRLGDTLSVAAHAEPLAPPQTAGTRAGTVTVLLRGAPVGTWTLATERQLFGPSPWWKLLNG